MDSFVQLGHGSLVEQQDYTQGDNTKKLPTDGTVHELTSNTLKYLGALGDYDVVTGHLLGTNGVLPQSDADDPIAGSVPWLVIESLSAAHIPFSVHFSFSAAMPSVPPHVDTRAHPRSLTRVARHRDADIRDF